jgi:hypothetical protein
MCWHLPDLLLPSTLWTESVFCTTMTIYLGTTKPRIVFVIWTLALAAMARHIGLVSLDYYSSPLTNG